MPSATTMMVRRPDLIGIEVFVRERLAILLQI